MCAVVLVSFLIGKGRKGGTYQSKLPGTINSSDVRLSDSTGIAVRYEYSCSTPKLCGNGQVVDSWDGSGTSGAVTNRSHSLKQDLEGR